jgi:uncharacterized protein (TIGR02246 family)
MSDADRNVAAIRAFHEAWNRHDLEGCLGFVAEDCEYVCGQGKLRRGRDGFVELWREAEPLMRSTVTAEQVISSGDTVVALTTARVTPSEQARHDHPGLPATWTIPHVDVMQMRDGKIVGGHTYNSFAQPQGDVVAHVADIEPSEDVRWSYANFSDMRLKRSVQVIPSAVERLRQLTTS